VRQNPASHSITMDAGATMNAPSRETSRASRGFVAAATSVTGLESGMRILGGPVSGHQVVMRPWILTFYENNLERKFLEHYWDQQKFWLYCLLPLVTAYVVLWVALAVGGDTQSLEKLDIRYEYARARGYASLDFIFYHVLWVVLFGSLLAVDATLVEKSTRWIFARQYIIFFIMLLDLFITAFVNPEVTPFVLLLYVVLLRVPLPMVVALVSTAGISILAYSEGHANPTMFWGLVAICLTSSREIEIASRLALYRLWLVRGDDDWNRAEVNSFELLHDPEQGGIKKPRGVNSNIAKLSYTRTAAGDSTSRSYQMDTGLSKAAPSPGDRVGTTYHVSGNYGRGTDAITKRSCQQVPPQMLQRQAGSPGPFERTESGSSSKAAAGGAGGNRHYHQSQLSTPERNNCDRWTEVSFYSPAAPGGRDSEIIDMHSVSGGSLGMNSNSVLEKAVRFRDHEHALDSATCLKRMQLYKLSEMRADRRPFGPEVEVDVPRDDAAVVEGLRPALRFCTQAWSAWQELLYEHETPSGTRKVTKHCQRLCRNFAFSERIAPATQKLFRETFHLGRQVPMSAADGTDTDIIVSSIDHPANKLWRSLMVYIRLPYPVEHVHYVLAEPRLYPLIDRSCVGSKVLYEPSFAAPGEESKDEETLKNENYVVKSATYAGFSLVSTRVFVCISRPMIFDDGTRVLFSKSIEPRAEDKLDRKHVIGNLSASCWFATPLGPNTTDVVLVSHLNPRGSVGNSTLAGRVVCRASYSQLDLMVKDLRKVCADEWAKRTAGAA